MKDLVFPHLPPWAIGLSLLLHLAAGVGLGALYFGSLWRNTQSLASGGKLAGTIAWAVGRFALLGGILLAISREGALPLLITALGVMIARALVTRSVRSLR